MGSSRIIMKKAIEKYGPALQITVAIEEMSELQKELCKYFRGKSDAEHIAEEMADVEIMLQQLEIIFGNNRCIQRYRSQKLQRLNNNIVKEGE